MAQSELIEKMGDLCALLESIELRARPHNTVLSKDVRSASKQAKEIYYGMQEGDTNDTRQSRADAP